jgi:hypothetical protein
VNCMVCDLPGPSLSRPIGVKARSVGEIEGRKRSGGGVIREAYAGQAQLVVGRGALDRKLLINQIVRETEAELVHHFGSDGVVIGNDETAIVLRIDVVWQQRIRWAELTCV